MSKKDEFDLDEEVKRLSRKSNINMKKTEYSFDNRLKKLDKEMDNILDEKIKAFDDSKEMTSDYLKIDYSDDTIKRYKEKLRKM